jgi:uncharacterized OB-fold protein/acyl dehydratase
MQRLAAFVGEETPAPHPARDPVNQPMIRHWCDAVEDRNPIYTDPGFAARTLHGGIVAPPTMLQAWTMPGLAPPAGGGRPAWRGAFQALDEAGFTSVVATNCRQEYRRYLRPGDHLNVTASIAAISEEKQTALGPGHFLTQRMTYRDQHGEVVATMDFRMLKFKPRRAAARAATPSPAAGRLRSRPARNQDSAFFWEGLREGRLLVSACAGCGVLRHPPEPMCPACGSLEWKRVACSGRGSIHSFVVAHHPPIPPFEYPHPVVLVDLEEGLRIVAEITGVAPGEIRIGMPVQAVFEAAAPDDDLVVPRFRRAGDAT